MNRPMLWLAVLTSAMTTGVNASTIDFTTFVPSSSISAAEGGNTSAIAFNFAGDKFVGTVYFDNQLFQTNLSGGGVAKFGSPLPLSSGAVGEVVVGVSLGQAGFPTADVYAGSQANSSIYHYANGGGTPSLFATLPSTAGVVRQIFFDPGSSFGGNMLVTTSSGQIYKVDATGTPTLLANIGEDTEGMDIAPSSWGSYAGDLMVASEGSGSLRLVSPSGTVTVVNSRGSFPGAETVSAIPTNLDPTNPLEGFYVANYATNIQFAAGGQFVTQGILGDVIVTDEFGGSTAWDLHFNPGTATFTSTPFSFTGNAIIQFEDGIFVTGARITGTGGGGSTVPEPMSALLLCGGLLCVAAARRKIRPNTRLSID